MTAFVVLKLDGFPEIPCFCLLFAKIKFRQTNHHESRRQRKSIGPVQRAARSAPGRGPNTSTSSHLGCAALDGCARLRGTLAEWRAVSGGRVTFKRKSTKTKATRQVEMNKRLSAELEVLQSRVGSEMGPRAQTHGSGLSRPVQHRRANDSPSIRPRSAQNAALARDRRSFNSQFSPQPGHQCAGSRLQPAGDSGGHWPQDALRPRQLSRRP